MKQLTSIEENSTTDPSCSSAEDVSSMQNNDEQEYKQHEIVKDRFPLAFQPCSSGEIASTLGKANYHIEPEKSKQDVVYNRKSSRAKSESSTVYPDLGFLENDVGLWDAFFLHGKNSRSHRYIYI